MRNLSISIFLEEISFVLSVSRSVRRWFVAIGVVSFTFGVVELYFSTGNVYLEVVGVLFMLAGTGLICSAVKGSIENSREVLTSLSRENCCLLCGESTIEEIESGDNLSSICHFCLKENNESSIAGEVSLDLFTGNVNFCERLRSYEIVVLISKDWSDPLIEGNRISMSLNSRSGLTLKCTLRPRRGPLIEAGSAGVTANAHFRFEKAVDRVNLASIIVRIDSCIFQFPIPTKNTKGPSESSALKETKS